MFVRRQADLRSTCRTVLQRTKPCQSSGQGTPPCRCQATPWCWPSPAIGTEVIQHIIMFGSNQRKMQAAAHQRHRFLAEPLGAAAPPRRLPSGPAASSAAPAVSAWPASLPPPPWPGGCVPASLHTGKSDICNMMTECCVTETAFVPACRNRLWRDGARLLFHRS